MGKVCWPRLTATEMVTEFTDRIKKIRLVAIETQGAIPTPEQVATMRKLADDGKPLR